MRVLCVDDDRVNTLLLEHTLLGISGLELQCAESGAEALALVQHWHPELLVIDLHLPDTNGLALLHQLRQSLGTVPPVRAVLCTAERLQDVAAAAQAAGFDQTWTKPVALDDVRAAIAQWSLDVA
jgi:two-component system, OmpR family, response regulator